MDKQAEAAEITQQVIILESIIDNCQDRIVRLMGASCARGRVNPDVAVLAERRDRAQRAVEEMRAEK